MYSEISETDEAAVVSAGDVRLEQLDEEVGRLIVQVDGVDSLERLQSALNSEPSISDESADAEVPQSRETAIETAEWDIVLKQSSSESQSSPAGGEQPVPSADRVDLPVADSPQTIKDEYHDVGTSHTAFRDLIFGTLYKRFNVDPAVIDTAEMLEADGRASDSIEPKTISDLLACFYMASRMENDPIPISWVCDSWTVFPSEEKTRNAMNQLKADLDCAIPPINPATLIRRIIERLPDEPFDSSPAEQKEQLLPTATFIAGYFFSDGVCRTKNTLSVAGASIYIADSLATKSLNQQTVADACRVSSRSIVRAYPALEEAISELPFSLKPRILDVEACLQLREHTSRELVTNDLDPVQFTTLKGMPIDRNFIDSLVPPREYSASVR
ncbi:hypothetical protein [Halostagnicola sp. A-GB9-2]|uniref:cyclin family protein n=1 Tax=Halostagnicola sp. A-GB9-2 TaxID=3048066 RepID=UPI0024BF6F81|nr:hypothetical protein [Halostagnicola sp. A-GB9-2]MDJ1434291.1 hypothetical protein [Halostagnicola sp. A-GB9-2]